MALSQGVPFTIKILEGELSVAVIQDGQPPGQIQLIGWSLPFRPVEYGGEQRMQTSWYPGNPVATQQVVGPTLDPTTVNGKWLDSKLGDGVALQLLEMFEDIRERGLSLRVSAFDGVSADAAVPLTSSKPLERVGLLKKTSFKVHHATDVEWTLTFEWRSRGQAAAPTIVASNRTSPRDGMVTALDGIQTSQATWDALRDGPLGGAIGMPADLENAIDAAFENLAVAQVAIEQASAAIASVSLVPIQQARQLIGACQSVVGNLQDAAARVLGVPALALVARDDALDLLSLRVPLLQTAQAFLSAAGAASDARDGLAEIAVPDFVAEVSAPAGTDLRDIALQVYGDPDLWWEIAQANGITGSAVPAPPTGPSDTLPGPIRCPRVSGASSLTSVC